MAIDCPSETTILALLDGELSAPERTGIDRHVDGCHHCRQLISELGRGAGLASATDPTALPDEGVGEQLAVATSGREELPLAPGETVGRYRILRAIGSGGMGLVYAAEDPRLGRRVALKLLRPNQTVGSPSEARFLREAKAMARLSHPNVVAVHDGGHFLGRVFVAMELVDGLTLGDWLRARSRTWEEVLDVFRAAGRGLAAAHAAGLVHRDFKPGNVFVSRAGEVKVGDFGLALLPDEAAGAPGESLPAASEAPLDRLTRSGALLGTPAYMAPEQLRGEAADAASDQFSFCVALYEGLYEQRPFAGATLDTLRDSISCHRVGHPPRGSDVPGWVRRVVLRGLAPRRGDRFSGMDALLAALGRDPRVIRRRAALALAALAAVGAAIGWAAWSHRGVCADPGEQLSRVWDGARQRAVRSAFLSLGRPYARDAWARTKRALDRYTERWAALHHAVCEARERGHQSADLFHRKMWCLHQRLEEAKALTGVLARADDAVLRRAVQAARALPEVDACSRGAAFDSGAAGLAPAARAKVVLLRGQLAMARALKSAGKYAEGERLAGAAVTRARAVRSRPLEAEALLVHGELLEKVGKNRAAQRLLQEAVWMAHGGGHDRVAVQAAAQLVHLHAYRLGDLSEAQRWARHARAGLSRLGSVRGLSAFLHEAVAELRYAQGRYDDAAKEFGRSLALKKEHFGADHPEVAEGHSGVGVVLWTQGKYEEALEHHRRARAILEAALGPKHPSVATALNNIALVRWRQGRHREALRLYRECVSLRERALGPDHLDLATSLSNMGSVLRALGRYRESVAVHRRAVKIRERKQGPAHPDLAFALNNLGAALVSQGRLREAMGVHRRALGIRRKALRPGHPEIAYSLLNLGKTHRALKSYPEALRSYRSALKILEATRGKKHPLVARALCGIGESLLGAGRAAEAIASFERAAAIHAANKGAHFGLARARFGLAQSLWTARRERKRARKLALLAQDGFARSGQAGRKALAQVKVWLIRR